MKVQEGYYNLSSVILRLQVHINPHFPKIYYQ